MRKAEAAFMSSTASVPRRNAALDFLGEAAVVLLHPQDAGEANVIDGQPVVVRTNRGQSTGTAKVDAAIRRGVVSIPHGHHHTNVNVLTDKNDIDPITAMVRYSGFPVTIEPLLDRP